MRLWLRRKVRGVTRADAHRLQRVVWPITQAAIATGLAWYLAHDVLAHPQPFFAPIAAAVSLSASNVLRTERAIQMIIGVALGIGIGTGVQALRLSGSIGIAVAAFIAFCVAVLIGRGLLAQGLMFANQTAVAAILILALPQRWVGPERLFDALIGGGLALLFSVLIFPADPLAVLRDAHTAVVRAIRDALAAVADCAQGLSGTDPALALSDRLNQQLAALTQARSTARQVVRTSPRRWAARDAVRIADQQAAKVALYASSVLHLTRAIITRLNKGEGPPQAVRTAISELAAAWAALATGAPDEAAAHADAVHRLTAALHDAGKPVLAAIVDDCAKDVCDLIAPDNHR